MAHVMMMLGPYRFSLDTAAYQSLTRSAEYHWPQQDRIGAHPASEFTGAGPEVMSLAGVIYPEFKGGLGQIDRMRAVAGLGVPMPLISGAGRVFGFWAVTGISETQTIFVPGGVPLKIEFSMELQRYDGGLASLMRL